MPTYEDYAASSGLSVFEVRTAVRQLFSLHRKEAIKHEPKTLEPIPFRKVEPECGIITKTGVPCKRPAKYESEENGMVCGIHKDRTTYIYQQTA